MTPDRPFIAIVDHDDSLRESVPDLLRKFGFGAKTFSSAGAFLASDVVGRTNCLILDTAMPGMTGPELQHELKRRGQTIPIVFVTAHADGAVRPRLVEDGSADSLLKPFSETALWNAVTAALRDGRPEHLRAAGAAATPNTPIVFVVDDDISVRESLELLIAEAGWRPETFASAREFLDRPPATTACCLVLDVSLPDLNGLELQQRIAGDRGDMPIIFITGYGDVPMTVKAMKAGAIEFLTKPFSNETLRDAIENAIKRSRTALGHKAELRDLRHRHASLSPREREVMALVVSGLLNKRIGGELGISEITVKAHRGRVMRKMHAESLADLVTMAARLRP